MAKRRGNSILGALLGGLLKGLVGRKQKPAKQAQKRASKPTSRAPVAGHGDYSHEVVGESHYQDAIRRIKASKDKPFHRARLIAEDTNPHDNLAVRVDLDGATVGYLPRAAARAWRESGARPTTCDAYLADAGGGRPIGVWLRY